MVSLYATLIISKRKTFDEVPANLQDAVKEKLLSSGYDTNGDPIALDE